jgi:hypothetical protein
MPFVYEMLSPLAFRGTEPQTCSEQGECIKEYKFSAENCFASTCFQAEGIFVPLKTRNDTYEEVLYYRESFHDILLYGYKSLPSSNLLKVIIVYVGHPSSWLIRPVMVHHGVRDIQRYRWGDGFTSLPCVPTHSVAY